MSSTARQSHHAGKAAVGAWLVRRGVRGICGKAAASGAVAASGACVGTAAAEGRRAREATQAAAPANHLCKGEMDGERTWGGAMRWANVPIRGWRGGHDIHRWQPRWVPRY